LASAVTARNFATVLRFLQPKLLVGGYIEYEGCQCGFLIAVIIAAFRCDANRPNHTSCPLNCAEARRAPSGGDMSGNDQGRNINAKWSIWRRKP
jgi:hypothetical protein